MVNWDHKVKSNANLNLRWNHLNHSQNLVDSFSNPKFYFYEETQCLSTVNNLKFYQVFSLNTLKVKLWEMRKKNGAQHNWKSENPKWKSHAEINQILFSHIFQIKLLCLRQKNHLAFFAAGTKSVLCKIHMGGKTA